MKTAPPNTARFALLLQGEPKVLSDWVQNWTVRHLLLNLAVIIGGTAAYGAAMGVWRDEMQAVYTGIKLPLVILLTIFGNALLNGMLAPLFGANLTFRQSLLAVMMSFAAASAILGAFSPLIFFLVWNSPPFADRSQAGAVHSFILLTHVAVIGFAGVTGNLQLFRFLAHATGNRAAALKILFSWLLANLFFGTQLSWILRPFVGSPGLPLQFLRDDALRGNFFEAVFHAIRHLTR
ncbi:MAG: hypothetical protein H0X66_04515 [Verrucomicrobia bacterium]|nr:hypothetical protein [Verrucomicrobiota bacterium]